MVKNGEYGAGSGKGFYDGSNPRKPRPCRLSEYIIGNAEDMTKNIKSKDIRYRVQGKGIESDINRQHPAFMPCALSHWP